MGHADEVGLAPGCTVSSESACARTEGNPVSRRLAALALSTALVVTFLADAPAAAVTSAPLPTSMAAVGDSITQAASSGGSLGADYPGNSWSTGTSTTVNSHFLRLAGLSANIVEHNRSVSGAKVGDLNAQMLNVAALDPDPGYLTVLIGGNDLCTDTVAEMTSVDDFRARFTAAMQTITGQSPNTYVYVVSIPDVYRLWELFKGNFWARFVWSSGDICQSLLANPTSTKQVDVERRAQVRQRNIDFNTVLEQVCESADFSHRCLFDENAVFSTEFTANDVSGDYFHPSIAGQAKLASVTWTAGYAWTSSTTINQPPAANFTGDCMDLACDFTDTSTDGDGTIASRSWSFGDGATSIVTNPSHTYAAAGTYTVSLTVTDDDGASATTSRSVTVSTSEPPPPDADASMSVSDLDGGSQAGKGHAWTATVTVTIADDAGSPLPGATVTGTWTSGGSSTCTTGSDGTCSVSVSVNGRKATTTTYTVADVALSGYTYVADGNNDPDADSDGTSITITR